MKKSHTKSDVMKLVQKHNKFQILELNEFIDKKLVVKALEAEMKDSVAVIFVKK